MFSPRRQFVVQFPGGAELVDGVEQGDDRAARCQVARTGTRRMAIAVGNHFAPTMARADEHVKGRRLGCDGCCSRRQECISPWRPSSIPSSTWPKRRGLVYQSGEIYGGTKSAWDYGPLGVELKDNIKRQWWQSMVTGRDDVVGLDSSIILPREVWVASGHVDVFNDPLVECLRCHKRHRQDHMQEAHAERRDRRSRSRWP